MRRILCLALLSLLGYTSLPVDLWGCTTFLLSEKSTNRQIVGKVYDWHMGQASVFLNKKGLKKRAMLLDATLPAAGWVSRYASLTFNQYGFELPNGGMNAAGLVVEIMVLDESVYPQEIQGEAINEFQWIQYQLDNFGSVAEVVAHVSHVTLVPLGGKVHYMACDKTGTCAAFEYIDGNWVITKGNELRVKTLTNNTYAESAVFLSQYAGFGGTRAIPQTMDSLSRFVRASDLARRYVAGSVETYADQIIASVTGKTTKWRIKYDPVNLRVYFNTTAVGMDKFIDLSRLDSLCLKPAVWWDIDLAKQGDVTALFKPYSREHNRSLVHRALEQSDPLPIEHAEEILTRFPESFSCSRS